MINWILENVLFPSGDAMMQTSFIKELKHWREVSKYSKQDIAALQHKNLSELLVYLAAHNRYYKGFLPPPELIQSADPVEVLKTLPILTKEIIRNNNTALISDSFLKNSHKLIQE